MDGVYILKTNIMWIDIGNEYLDGTIHNEKEFSDFCCNMLDWDLWNIVYLQSMFDIDKERIEWVLICESNDWHTFFDIKKGEYQKEHWRAYNRVSYDMTIEEFKKYKVSVTANTVFWKKIEKWLIQKEQEIWCKYLIEAELYDPYEWIKQIFNKEIFIK